MSERTSTDIYAVIGVWCNGPRTFYVKRSAQMKNYPNVWSLPSIQFQRDELEHPREMCTVADIFAEMQRERFGSMSFKILRYLTSASCADNPMKVPVHLHMYEFEMSGEPLLNADFYTSSIWLTQEEYAYISRDAQCGLCTRMWSKWLRDHS